MLIVFDESRRRLSMSHLFQVTGSTGTSFVFLSNFQTFASLMFVCSWTR